MSLLIGIHIQERLSKNLSVKKKVADRIFPLVVSQGSPSYPFIVFETSTSADVDTKDGHGDEISSVSVCVFAKSYGEAVRIANIVKEELQESTAKYDDFSVCESRFVNSDEDYNEDISAYIINVNFEFITN